MDPTSIRSKTLTKNLDEIISTFPKREIWKENEPLYQYQGFWYFPNYLKGILMARENFKAQPKDTFICSHPKTGTTWLKALAFAIATRKTLAQPRSHPLQTTLSHDCFPFLEFDAAEGWVRERPDVPLIGTHIPYNSLPGSVVEKGCKIVYISRDPKDTFISYWFFVNKFMNHERVSIERAMDLFCEGVFPYGPYWEHVQGYWKASLEKPDKVMFLKYEDLKADTALHVKQLASFMGQPFNSEEESQGMVQKVVDLCSFETMSQLYVSRNGTSSRFEQKFQISNDAFYRKGEVGDWKSYLTPEMGLHLDQVVGSKLRGSGLSIAASYRDDSDIRRLVEN